MTSKFKTIFGVLIIISSCTSQVDKDRMTMEALIINQKRLELNILSIKNEVFEEQQQYYPKVAEMPTHPNFLSQTTSDSMELYDSMFLIVYKKYHREIKSVEDSLTLVTKQIDDLKFLMNK